MLIQKRLTIAIAAAILSSSSAFAADVPAGVELAEKQEIVRGNGDELESLDAHKAQGVPEHNVLNDLFETLTITDPTGHLIPGAAVKWESSDNKTWIFHLRPEAKWSNGDPVTAQDFVFAWQRLADPKTAAPYASYFQYMLIDNIDDIIAGKKPPTELGIKAIDDHTLQLNLTAPLAYLPKMLTHFVLIPMNQKALETHGDKWTTPANLVTNGAFKLKEHVVGEKIVLERNEQYWDNKNTVLNQVTFLPIQSEVTEISRYRAGEIDMTYTNMPIELYQKLKQELPDELRTGPYLCTYFYEINNQRAPFTDPRVRAALKLGMEQSTMTEKVLAQGQTPAYTFTHKDIDGGNFAEPEWMKWTQEQRNEEAKRLLAEAGFTADKPLKFNLLYNTSDLHKKLAVAAGQIWKKNLGAEVVLENQEWKTYLDSRQQGNYDVARGAWCADYNDPSTFLNIMRSNSSNNTAKYKNPAFDALLDKAVLTQDDAERTALYQQAETLFDQETGQVPMFYYVNNRMVKPYVGGYSGKEPMDNIRAKDLYIIKH